MPPPRDDELNFLRSRALELEDQLRSANTELSRLKSDSTASNEDAALMKEPREVTRPVPHDEELRRLANIMRAGPSTVMPRAVRANRTPALAAAAAVGFILLVGVSLVMDSGAGTTQTLNLAALSNEHKSVSASTSARVSTPASWWMTLGIVTLVAGGGLAVSAHFAQSVLAMDTGTVEMQDVADAIKEGADGFLRQQYGTIAKFAVLVDAVLVFFYLLRAPPESLGEDVTRVQLAICVAVAFAVGALLSAFAGYVGMWVSVRANLRVAAAATRGYKEAMHAGIRAGGFCGILVVALVILGMIFLLILLPLVAPVGFPQLPFLLVGYGFGASFVALFAQLGGGIYTKAADVGGDMVGKVDAGIPEDDPRNPATIADLVGDNVGDCAGRGADLFESIAAEIIAAMILGSSLSGGLCAQSRAGFILFPLSIHAMDLVVSSIAIQNLTPKSLEVESPMTTLKAAYRIALFLASIGVLLLSLMMLSPVEAPGAWKCFAACGLIGICTAYAFILVTEYFTDYLYAPVRKIAAASRTGHGTNVIAGLATGMEATAPPVFCVVLAILLMYHFGQMAGVSEDSKAGGLYGTAVGTMGMLSTVAYVLAMDVFGPITDNAGGIVEMTEQPAHVRDITDALDAVGNTTKAITKGFSVGSAMMACFLLFTAFTDEVSEISGEKFDEINLASPPVFLSGVLGSTLVYFFSGRCMTAVGAAAQEVVDAVRQQFAERPGIMARTEKPDYTRCVAIVTAAAQREMVFPGLVSVCAPLVNGYFWRVLGSNELLQLSDRPDPLLGAKCTASFLMFATASGVLQALFLNTAGGAWDNAKKYIESGVFGGKGSDAHKAAVTGDTVGDPAKDTAGPSLHVLIKLLSTVTLVAAPLFVRTN
jgi:inorganic pyrophosphatase